MSTSQDGLKIWSCVTCRRRKVRCDRRDPCAHCVKQGIQCHFPVTGRLPRRSRDPAAASISDSSTTGGGKGEVGVGKKQMDLMTRVRRLESLVTELAGQVEEKGADVYPTTSSTYATHHHHHHHHPPASHQHTQKEQEKETLDVICEDRDDAVAKIDEELSEEFGKLVVSKDGSLHIGKGFWSVFCNEVNHIFEAVQQADQDPPAPVVKPASSKQPDPKHDSTANFLFTTSNSQIPPHFYPLPSQIPFLWSIYLSTIDPFIKILPISNVTTTIHHLSTSSSSSSISSTPFQDADPDFIPLLFAISLAAIASRTNDQVLTDFHIPRSGLITRFRLGTELSLAQIDFLSARRVIHLQALVIYLYVLPWTGSGSERRRIWPLTGILVRMATSLGLGLHREESIEKSTKQEKNGARERGEEAEMRRRLWWHICFLEARNREPGTPDLSIRPDQFNTKLPSRITNEGEPASEIALCQVRCEIWLLSRLIREHIATNPDFCLEAYATASERVEREYLCELEEGKLFDMFTRAMVKLFFANLQLSIFHHQARTLLHLFPLTSSADNKTQSKTQTQTQTQTRVEEVAERMFPPALTIIQTVHALLMTPGWKQWHCHLDTRFPWRAIGIVLVHVARAAPWSRVLDEAWAAARDLYVASESGLSAHSLWEPLERLFARAKRRVEGGGHKDSGSTSTHSTLAQTPKIDPPGWSHDTGLKPVKVHESDDLSLPHSWITDYLKPLADEPNSASSRFDLSFDENQGFLDQGDGFLSLEPMDWSVGDTMAAEDVSAFWDWEEITANGSGSI